MKVTVHIGPYFEKNREKVYAYLVELYRKELKKKNASKDAEHEKKLT